MEDELIFYLKSKAQDHLLASFDNTDVLVWGSRENEGVRLLGTTVNIGVADLQDTDYIRDARTSVATRIAHSLSKMTQTVFFSIVYPRSGTNGFRVSNPEHPTDWTRSQIVSQAEMPRIIQQFFNTNLRISGTGKLVNKMTSDWFQDWARVNLPFKYIRVNIDGIIIDDKGRARTILEVKRSSQSLNTWQPYQADGRNYLLQHVLAKKTGMDFWTLYHLKGRNVEDQTDIVFFEIIDVNLDGRVNWIETRRSKVKAGDLAKRILG